MAFIELSADALELLDEAEKAAYQRQLKLYQARTALIRKLEQIENAEIQIERTALPRIAPVKKPEIPQYAVSRRSGIRVPDDAERRRMLKDSVRQLRQRNERIRNELPHASVLSGMPKLRKIVPAVRKPFVPQPARQISGVAEKKPRITVPAVRFEKPAEREQIRVPRVRVPSVTASAFVYEKKPVNIRTYKPTVPAMEPFTAIGSVKVNAVPQVAVRRAEKPDFTFRPKQDTAKVRAIAAEAAKQAPSVSFTPVAAEVRNIPSVGGIAAADSGKMDDIRTQLSDFAVRCRVPDVKAAVPSVPQFRKPEVSVRVPDVRLKAPDIPSSASFRKPEIRTAVPSVTVPKAPAAGAYQAPAAELKMPAVPSMTVPKLDVRPISPVQVKCVPQIRTVRPAVESVKIAQPEIGALPSVQVRQAELSTEDVQTVIERIRRGVSEA